MIVVRHGPGIVADGRGQKTRAPVFLLSSLIRAPVYSRASYLAVGVLERTHPVGRAVRRDDIRRRVSIGGLFRVYSDLHHSDPVLAALLVNSLREEEGRLNLIASENYASQAVLAAQGCPLSSKYAEGYPGRRYYNGCAAIDEIEALARTRARELFGAEHANVQPHSGTQANMAAYYALVDPGATILGMDLRQGGHLSHGHPANFSGRTYKIVSYGLDRETERIDYDAVQKLAEEHRPALVVAGASSYPRAIDFGRFAEIAKSVGAFFLADIAHVAGLVAARLHPDPTPVADVVTFTTHKTMRGPRGAVVLSRTMHANGVDRAVFPGVQGGPMLHEIAAKAVCFHEASQETFRIYQRSVVANAAALADSLAAEGFRLVTGGTDNHLLLIDLSKSDVALTGKQAATLLEEAGIVCNKNVIPFDTRPPDVTSGIRLGTPAATARGFGSEEMRAVGRAIAGILRAPDDEDVKKRVRQQVHDWCAAFPLGVERRPTAPSSRKVFQA
ncbi:MAG: serine hydroxymethyltransferase [Planctomycetes bacterium]|nr:serine hydroxymethyltransferase [Planctomycetota bacterium]